MGNLFGKSKKHESRVTEHDKAVLINLSAAMDPTADIRKVSSSNKNEYVKIIMNVILPFINDSRPLRKEKFEAAIQQLTPEAKKHYAFIEKRELIHYEFMKVIFKEGYKRVHKVPLPKEVPDHDCSKDRLFYFILAACYDVFTGKDKDNLVDEEADPEFKSTLQSLVKKELDRHYRLEPHHPEHEELTGNECTDRDLLEMALDRLARNVQFNHGEIDMGKMDKFRPTFTLGDTKKKDEVYWKYVKDLSDMVSQQAKAMYFSG